MDCTICFETYDSLYINWLPCSHNLCTYCYNKLEQLICPFCRAPLNHSTSNIRHIENRHNSTNNNRNNSIQTIQTTQQPLDIVDIVDFIDVMDFDVDVYDEYNVVEHRRENRERRRQNNLRRNRYRQNYNNNNVIVREFITDDENQVYELIISSTNDKTQQKIKNQKNLTWNNLNRQRSKYSK